MSLPEHFKHSGICCWQCWFAVGRLFLLSVYRRVCAVKIFMRYKTVSIQSIAVSSQLIPEATFFYVHSIRKRQLLLLYIDLYISIYIVPRSWNKLLHHASSRSYPPTFAWEHSNVYAIPFSYSFIISWWITHFFLANYFPQVVSLVVLHNGNGGVTVGSRHSDGGVTLSKVKPSSDSPNACSCIRTSLVTVWSLWSDCIVTAEFRIWWRLGNGRVPIITDTYWMA